jgi:hypothetical protein
MCLNCGLAASNSPPCQTRELQLNTLANPAGKADECKTKASTQVCYVAFWAVTDPRNKVATVTMKSRLSHD